MKYKVVKDPKNILNCRKCSFKDIGCLTEAKLFGLPDCITGSCHFELADEITTTDLRQKDNADDEK